MGLFLPVELDIPFVPAFIWIYLSMYVLFLMPGFLMDPPELRALARLFCWHAALGNLLPAGSLELGFPREAPADPVQAAIFQKIFSVDLPHNMAPSLHVVWSTLFLAAIKSSFSRRARFVWWVWLVRDLCFDVLFISTT